MTENGLTPQERTKLDDLWTEFRAVGGRDPELADLIDQLEAKEEGRPWPPEDGDDDEEEEEEEDACEECNGLDKHFEHCPYLTGEWPDET